VFAKSTKLVGVFGVALVTLLLARARQGRSRGRPGAQSTKNPTVEAEGEVEELAEVGSRLEEAQAQADASSSRARSLDLQTQRLRTCAKVKPPLYRPLSHSLPTYWRSL
jgi:hypothetical protein